MVPTFRTAFRGHIFACPLVTRMSGRPEEGGNKQREGHEIDIVVGGYVAAESCKIQEQKKAQPLVPIWWCTGPQGKFGPRLREVPFCHCFTILPGPALLLLKMICKSLRGFSQWMVHAIVCLTNSI